MSGTVTLSWFMIFAYVFSQDIQNHDRLKIHGPNTQIYKQNQRLSSAQLIARINTNSTISLIRAPASQNFQMTLT